MIDEIEPNDQQKAIATAFATGMAFAYLCPSVPSAVESQQEFIVFLRQSVQQASEELEKSGLVKPLPEGENKELDENTALFEYIVACIADTQGIDPYGVLSDLYGTAMVYAMKVSHPVEMVVIGETDTVPQEWVDELGSQ